MATILPAARRPSRYGEEIELGDVTVKFHPAGHVLGSAQIAVSCKDTCIVASGDYKDAPDPTCTPFEVVPCDVFITEATFGLPVFRHGDAARRSREAAGVGGAVSRARASGRRLFARQGAARDRADPAGRLRRADLSARRDGEDHALLREPRRRARRSAPGQGREEGRSRRHHHAGAAVGDLGYLDAALSRSGHGVCVGLDAGARPGAAARRRTAAGDFGPRRLGRPDRDHRRHRRRRNLGHPRPGRRAGALVHGQGPDRAAAGSGRLWRRGREDEALPAARAPRHEPLRRTARPPRLRARPQQQAAADHRLFSRGRPTPIAATRWRR